MDGARIRRPKARHAANTPVAVARPRLPLPLLEARIFDFIRSDLHRERARHPLSPRESLGIVVPPLDPKRGPLSPLSPRTRSGREPRIEPAVLYPEERAVSFVAPAALTTNTQLYRDELKRRQAELAAARAALEEARALQPAEGWYEMRTRQFADEAHKARLSSRVHTGPSELRWWTRPIEPAGRGHFDFRSESPHFSWQQLI